MLATVRSIGRRFADDERGASLVEYALLLALIAVVCFGAVTFFGGSSGNSITNSCNEIRVATNSTGDC